MSNAFWPDYLNMQIINKRSVLHRFSPILSNTSMQQGRSPTFSFTSDTFQNEQLNEEQPGAIKVQLVQDSKRNEV